MSSAWGIHSFTKSLPRIIGELIGEKPINRWIGCDAIREAEVVNPTRRTTL